MIASLHVASGAAAGALVGSRGRALAVGLLLHIVGDRIPHGDIASTRFELASAVTALLGLAARRGPLDPALIGALAASAPDAEHILDLPRPGGRKLFPSHRFSGWHREGRVSPSAQLLLAGALLGAVISRPRAGTI